MVISGLFVYEASDEAGSAASSAAICLDEMTHTSCIERRWHDQKTGDGERPLSLSRFTHPYDNQYSRVRSINLANKRLTMAVTVDGVTASVQLVLASCSVMLNKIARSVICPVSRNSGA